MLRNSTNTRDEVKENGQRGKPAQRVGAMKRQVLGSVGNNQVRRQPQRNAKDKHAVLQNGVKPVVGQENVAPNVAKQQKGFSAFQIFEDVPVENCGPRLEAVVHHDEPMFDQENVGEPQQLHRAVVGLNIGAHMTHKPLAPLQLDTLLSGSPMVIEDSDSEEEAVKVDEFGLEPYLADVYNYLRSTERLTRPSKNYMERQNDVSTSMRNILVDWLVEVGEEYKLHRETLFLAVNYLDRFLSLVGVQRPKLQLVGTACMFIAAKYEEIYPPDVSEFVYITDDTYSKNQVIKMESVILKLLEFKVAVPTVNWFCERFMEVIKPSDQCKNLAFFLTELTLVEIEEFLPYTPSQIAASAIVIARSTLGEDDPWPRSAEVISKYSLTELEPCVRLLFRQYSRKGNLPQQAVVSKYEQDKFGKVSMIMPPPVLAIY